MAALRYRPFAKVIAISEAIANMLRERGVEDSRLVVIRDAVDTRPFAATPDCTAFRHEFDLSDSDFVLAAAGQLIARKGHRFLLEALAGLRKRYPQVRAVIFGTGELDAVLREQAVSLGLGETVRFAGFRGDLDDFMACFDVLVHPALAEGLGVVTLKAQAAGVPVVGFAAGGVGEAVAHGETGLLVAPESVAELETAIARLIDDDQMRQAMGAAGRERMQNDFGIVTMVDRHIGVYESVLNG